MNEHHRPRRRHAAGQRRRAPGAGHGGAPRPALRRRAQAAAARAPRGARRGDEALAQRGQRHDAGRPDALDSPRRPTSRWCPSARASSGCAWCCATAASVRHVVLADPFDAGTRLWLESRIRAAGHPPTAWYVAGANDVAAFYARLERETRALDGSAGTGQRRRGHGRRGEPTCSSSRWPASAPTRARWCASSTARCTTR